MEVVSIGGPNESGSSNSILLALNPRDEVWLQLMQGKLDESKDRSRTGITSFSGYRVGGISKRDIDPMPQDPYWSNRVPIDRIGSSQDRYPESDHNRDRHHNRDRYDPDCEDKHWSRPPRYPDRRRRPDYSNRRRPVIRFPIIDRDRTRPQRERYDHYYPNYSVEESNRNNPNRRKSGYSGERDNNRQTGYTSLLEASSFQNRVRRKY